jgi:hypothetical protein
MVAEGGEDESYESGAGFPVSGSTTILPGVGRVGAVHGPAPAREPQEASQPPATVHPPFAPQPAFHVHVGIRMQRVLTEACWDSGMTPAKLLAALQAPFNELVGLVEQERDQARRMERNQRTAAAQAAVLEDAVLRGEGERAAGEAVAAMAGRAVHVAAEQSTGMLPRITEEMPDPRLAEPESAPLPSVPFLTAASMSAGVAVADEAMALRTPVAPVEDEESADDAEEWPVCAGTSLGARVEWPDETPVMVAPCGQVNARIQTPVRADVTCPGCVVAIDAGSDELAEAGTQVAA